MVACALTVPTARASEAAMVGSAPASQPIQLVLPLRADSAGLRRRALAVTTPGSPRYAQYESIAWLAARFGASPGTRRGVMNYLRRAGATNVKLDATGLFVAATMKVGLAERLFATALALFRAGDGARFIAPGVAHASAATVPVPAGLRGLVTAVVGLDSRPLATAPEVGRPSDVAGTAQATSAMAHSGTSSGCAAGEAAGTNDGAPAVAGFTPNQYLTAYGYDPLYNAGYRGQGERVALIEIDGFKDYDMLSFARCFGLRVPPIDSFGVALRHALAPGGEATLDIELLDAAAPGLKSIDVYEANGTAAGTLAALTAPLQNPGHKPQVISASLGLCEQNLLDALGGAGILASEDALEMAAASGVSFLASSGDSGSADCQDPNGEPLPYLDVNYPASSWWATGVGGTNLELSAANQIVAQPVWNDGDVQLGSAGGGGLSDLFYRPGYQKGVVSQNRRAVPDVAMLADIIPGYSIFCSALGDCVNNENSDPWQTVGGTSAATPLLAGGLALVDQELRIHGRQDLGLANPLLYAIGRSRARSEVFFDVTTGDNELAGLHCCSAKVGYDEASGWGSVNLASFAAVALATVPKIAAVTLSLPGGQAPVANHRIDATVSCSSACLAGAYARIAIGRSKPFEADSGVYRLRRKGSRKIVLALAGRRLSKLRSALSRRVRIDATVYGVVVDAAGDIERQTSGKKLAITS